MEKHTTIPQPTLSDVPSLEPSGDIGTDDAIATKKPAEIPEVPTKYCEARWYAAYTSANHERRVAQQLDTREVESFLPTYVSMRKWKDRRVTLELPLFPGYVFVRIALQNRLRLLQIPGVARLVTFNGMPAELPVQEIQALKAALECRLDAQPHPYLTVGRRVRIKSGPLDGFEGILARWRGRSRIVLSVGLIQRSVSVEIEASKVEPILN